MVASVNFCLFSEVNEFRVNEFLAIMVSSMSEVVLFKAFSELFKNVFKKLLAAKIFVDMFTESIQSHEEKCKIKRY